MRKLTKKEYEQLEFKKRGAKTEDVLTGALTNILTTLKVGEHYYITHEEWLLKTPPITLMKQMLRRPRYKGKDFRGRTLADDSGWVITRIT